MTGWRFLDAEACAVLRRFHDNFAVGARAAQCEAELIIAEIKAQSPRPRWPTRRSREEEYELRWLPFDTFCDGQRSAGA